MSGTPSKYTVEHQHELERFVRSAAAAHTNGMVLDSASAASAAFESIKSESGATPRVLDELLGKASEKDEPAIVQALFDGARDYQTEHGFAPSGDLLLSAVDQAYSLYDSANNSHHDQISLVPNAPVVAILGSMAEACPFAGYLPADRGSNEARLIIVSHQAGSNWGDYTQGDLMDGIASGGSYLGAARTLELSAPNDTAAYKFTFQAQKGAGAALNLLRGRSIVYVNGQIAAVEISNGPSTAASVPIVGSIVLAGTTYNLTGTVKPATGEVSITPDTPFPAGTVVNCEAFVDFEIEPSVTPKMAVQAMVYQMFAAPYRAVFQSTPETRSQFANEVGVDPSAEAMMVVRNQYAMERHYNAINKAKMVGRFNNTAQYDFQYAEQILQKTRAQIWQDFQAVLGVVSQKMAEQTADHGVTHLYVTKAVMAQFRSMPSDLFQPSGLTDRAGIYRIGRLFGQYDVYYTPKGLNEAADGSSAEILCVGRSSQTARCPIIFGDASAPIFEPLGMATDLKQGYGFNARSFTNLNPHAMSAAGCALIQAINLK
ncbi:hypothetical protein LA345_38970 (plasmid) [Burkholderia vietnamiensis]|uniref:Uncharacterized protein n=1 Tax=Burkholderia vietnamiensis (strain G4 / LMG 22486) TaxID=269482 RepID=A4JWF4_BURVG|nr:hypothetical protein Bcep1808_7737 [Burkholderia vietnamiensis G4]MCB4349782.1 hypothetical protein [Burkholderia vietnamiensis]